MAQGPALGLQLGLAAFLVVIVSPLHPALGVLFVLLGAAALAVLASSARAEAPARRRAALVALGVALGGFLALLATNALANASFQARDFALWKATAGMRFAAEVAIAAGFALAPQHLAAERSRVLLGVGVGAAATVSGLAAVGSLGPAEELAASWAAATAGGAAPPPGWEDQALLRYLGQVQAANQAKTVPFIILAWAYATILGRLRKGIHTDGQAVK